MMLSMWAWGILGLILLGAEMLSGTLYLLWFGASALLLAILVWLLPSLSVAIQLFLFSALALCTILAVRQHEKKYTVDCKIGQSQGEEIGRIGTIIEAVSPNQSGRIQFVQGVMGSREWVVVADETLLVNCLACVIAVEGNSLRVKAQREIVHF